MSSPLPALLALADGTVFRGLSIGATGEAQGEVVFNTAICGYQEILTDPSYCRQIVTLTHPHVGNVGANPDDDESEQAHCSGLVIRDVPTPPSNWRAREDFVAWLKRRGVIAIAEVDTRRLTRLLREKGAQNACIQAGTLDEARALRQARAFGGLAGLDLAEVVSAASPYEWTLPSWAGPDEPPRGDEAAGSGADSHGTRSHGAHSHGAHSHGGDRHGGDSHGGRSRPPARYRVVAYDFGVKRNILRMLVDRGCRVTVVPARTPAADALAMRPDGIFLSNGPGDPQPCDYAIDAIAEFLRQPRLPLFGVCLGHQLLALASGARTLKMKFGHHGANHPVQDLESGRVFITSQNHGFAVLPETLPPEAVVTHVSLFDGTNEGFAVAGKPVFSVQYHPEASPGPQDSHYLFRRFADLIEKHA